MKEADSIWEEIRDLPLEGLYGLDNQTVEEHVTRLAGTENSLYLKLRAPAVIASLEELISKQTTVEWKRNEETSEKHRISTKKFELEEAEGYVIVKRLLEKEETKKHDANIFISNKRKDLKNARPLTTPEVTEEGTVVAGTKKALKQEGRFTIEGGTSED